MQRCLHCEIGDLINARDDESGTDIVRQLCEVITDLVASIDESDDDGLRAEVQVMVLRTLLCDFARINRGAYKIGQVH